MVLRPLRQGCPCPRQGLRHVTLNFLVLSLPLTPCLCDRLPLPRHCPCLLVPASCLLPSGGPPLLQACHQVSRALPLANQLKSKHGMRDNKSKERGKIRQTPEQTHISAKQPLGTVALLVQMPTWCPPVMHLGFPPFFLLSLTVSCPSPFLPNAKHSHLREPMTPAASGLGGEDGEGRRPL